ncbi:MAG TPA: MFS transporter [Gemmatimonadaceae bacterium]|nr:MFS transporter [Gemmatimonadaceae bacterium]
MNASASGALSGWKASTGYAWYVAAVLMLANVSAFIDRQILALMVDPIRADLGISDTQMSLLLGLAFAVFYSLMGIPIGRLADSGNRRAIIAVGIALWSGMCTACGLARSYWQLFLARVGVGIGEAALTPPAYSLLADYFPPARLAGALSVFSMGIFLGSGLAYLVGGTVIEVVQGMDGWPLLDGLRPWQRVFVVVGVPGLVLALLMLTVREPARRSRSERTPPMRMLIQYLRVHRGAYLAHGTGYSLFSLVNYATAAWFPAYFMRVHGWSAGKVGLYMGGATLAFGSLGVLAGGRLATWMSNRGKEDANLRVGTVAALGTTLAALPLYLGRSEAVVVVALLLTNVFAAFPWGAAAAAVQEMTPADMRGQASALFLLLVNVIGLALGPTAVAILTDHVFARDEAVGLSLLVVTLVGRLVAAGSFASGATSYAAAVRTARAWTG